MSLVFLKNDTTQNDFDANQHMKPYDWLNNFDTPLILPPDSQVAYISSTMERDKVVNFEGDVSLTTTTRYRWSLGTDLSPYNTNSIILENDGVSLFKSQTGDSSFGTIPAEGSTITMESRQENGQNYFFNSATDKFKYLVSNTNYNEANLNTLLPLLNTSTPITGSGSNYQSSFVYSNVAEDDYLYMVWDLRESTSISLCYDETSTIDVCCDCQP
jgi:hypothetical protein